MRKLIVVAVLAPSIAGGILCPKGSYLNATLAKCLLCPAGTFGSSPGLTTSNCSGPCTAGFYCPLGSTSSTPQECGPPTYFCPSGAPVRQVVAPGYYTTASSLARLGLDDSLDLSAYQAAAAQLPCDRGYYCLRGIRYACPPGTFGQTVGLQTSDCSGLCPPGTLTASWRLFKVKEGSYCPLASAMPTPCPPGVFGATSGLNTSACSAPCPLGSFCRSGTIAPEPCPAGLFGNATGLSRKECSLECSATSCVLPLCAAGYYCPLGTLAPIPCGSSSVYCPQGSSMPTAVSAGYYTIVTASLNSIDATLYLPGKRPSSQHERRFTALLSSVRAWYLLPQWLEISLSCWYFWFLRRAGVVCVYCSLPQWLLLARDTTPEGSPTYANNPCLDPSVYCPTGSPTPTVVTDGFWTVLSTDDARLRVSQQICPLGSYCVQGVAHLCPTGTFGNTTGLASSACSGRCNPGSICPRGTISPQGQPCPAGTYTTNGQQCLPCQPGFWCTAGASSPTQRECGDSTVYCPLGAANPLVVQAGYYAANANSPANANADFTTQIQCPIANTALIPQCPSITQGPNSAF
ncbi:hypothetical protein AeMF1_013819 [Aphanomyces euteiches]|nr:hypothetical protein AeMF1_013819 [Aphanomyces euteiches]KAH9194514.1 hypothetical protein AeNC1_003517 [Aphanomyces euteiches]